MSDKYLRTLLEEHGYTETEIKEAISYADRKVKEASERSIEEARKYCKNFDQIVKERMERKAKERI